MKGLSSETLEAIILQVQEYRLLWDKAQGDYKDHDLKEVTWNKIGKPRVYTSSVAWTSGRGTDEDPRHR